MYDVRAGAGGIAMQLRVACERIGAAAFVNVGGGSDAVIAASDDGCVTMFDSRRSDLPLSVVEVSDAAAAASVLLCLLRLVLRNNHRVYASSSLCLFYLLQVHDSVSCLASDGWSLLAGDSQGRLHVIEVRCRTREKLI